jgi:signal transduction histidine kinase
MTGRADGPAGRDARVPAGCATLAVVLLLLVPLLAEAEPGAADGVPDPGAAAWWAVLVTLLAQSAALGWRRHRPEVVAVVVAAAVPVAAVAGIGSAVGLTSFAVLVAVYTLATLRAPLSVWTWLTVVALLVAAGHTVAGLRGDVSAGEAVANGLVQAVVLLGGPLLVAALVTARRESRSAREDRVLALEREYDALVQAAVARERTAMARELHDIAAHHLTGIAVMSAAIATQIDTDPAGAKAAVGDVRRQSTAVLRDLRSLVGLLRDPESAETQDGVRVATLAGVPGLVDEVVAGGQDVGLTVLRSTETRTLGGDVGPLAQLAAYRMVQESLANAARHAPGARSEVEIDDRDPEALVVTVRNAPGRQPTEQGSRGGLGLVGMRERAELTGSHLDVGPSGDGGWQVRLRTPRAEALDPGDSGHPRDDGLRP